MSRLKRFSIGTLVTAAALGGVTLLWYRAHYIVPPQPERKVNLPSPNGFDTLLAATKLEVKQKDGVFVSPRPINTDSYPYRYPDQPLEKRLKLLAANQAAITKTREALGQEYMSPDIEFPKNAVFREQARMLSFATRTYADAGNVAEAIRCSLDGQEMGVVIPKGGSVIPALVGIACEAIAQKPAWGLVEKLDAKTARNAALRLEKIDKRRSSLVEAVDLDRQFSQRSYLLTLFKGGPRNTWSTSGILFNSPDDLPQSDLDTELTDMEDRKQTLVEQARFLWLRAQVVYYGPKTVMENSEKWMKSVREYARHPWGSQRPPIVEPGDPLNKSTVIPFKEVEFKDLTIQTQSRLLQTYLALHAYRLEQGGYPKSLDQLVSAGYLKAVPVDPFSPTHAPLSYKSDGTLWSVGPDAKDDGGKPIDMQGKRGYVDRDKTGDFVARVNTY